MFDLCFIFICYGLYFFKGKLHFILIALEYSIYLFYSNHIQFARHTNFYDVFYL